MGGGWVWALGTRPCPTRRAARAQPRHPTMPSPLPSPASHELFFVAETNAEPPPHLPSHTHMVPPFTVQLWMWMLPLGHDFMRGGRCDPAKASFHIQRSVMYSDAGFDVSKCGVV